MLPAPHAIKLGFTQAASRWATGLLAVLATTADAFATVVLMLGFLAWFQGYERLGPMALLASVLVTLCARILLSLVHGGAIRQSAAWLKGVSTGTTLEEIFAAAPRSLAWFLWTLPIELLGGLWKWLGLAAVTWLYAHALGTKSGGAGASLTLALFLTATLPLAMGWAALSRATLVAAVRDELGPFAAATRALTWIANRPGAYLSVLGTGLLGLVGAEVVLSIFGSVASPGDAPGIEPTLAAELVGGALAAFTGALFELAILFGFTALESEPATPAVVPPPLPPPLPPADPLQPATPL